MSLVFALETFPSIFSKTHALLHRWSNRLVSGQHVVRCEAFHTMFKNNLNWLDRMLLPVRPSYWSQRTTNKSRQLTYSEYWLMRLRGICYESATSIVTPILHISYLDRHMYGHTDDNYLQLSHTTLWKTRACLKKPICLFKQFSIVLVKNLDGKKLMDLWSYSFSDLKNSTLTSVCQLAV